MNRCQPRPRFIWWSAAAMDAADMPHDLPRDALGVLEVYLPDGESALELQVCRGPSGRTVGIWRGELDDVIAIVVAGVA